MNWFQPELYNATSLAFGIGSRSTYLPIINSPLLYPPSLPASPSSVRRCTASTCRCVLLPNRREATTDTVLIPHRREGPDPLPLVRGHRRGAASAPIPPARRPEDWHSKYAERRASLGEEANPEAADAPSVDPVNERRIAIEEVQIRLKEEEGRHLRLARQVRENTLANLRMHLPELFRNMADFSFFCHDMYSSLKKNLHCCLFPWTRFKTDAVSATPNHLVTNCSEVYFNCSFSLVCLNSEGALNMYGPTDCRC